MAMTLPNGFTKLLVEDANGATVDITDQVQKIGFIYCNPFDGPQIHVTFTESHDWLHIVNDKVILRK